MKEICTGDRRYRIHALERNGEWVACAERADTGDPFGLEYAGLSEADVVDRMSRWLGWQHEHATALAALQAAQRAYHRTIAGTAFADQVAGPAAGRDRPTVDRLKESLERIATQRARLDAVRSRKPESPDPQAEVL